MADPTQYFAPLLPWHQSAWQRMVQQGSQQPHAIALTGMMGVGKRRFAQQMTAWLLCDQPVQQRACGQCQSCGWLVANTHPRLLTLSPVVDAKGKVSSTIKIDQIRDMIPFVQQTSDGFRVVVIEPAEKMNTAAANALLKTLEEPAERVILILVTDQLLQLPATIRSRVQQWHLGRITPQMALDYVQDEGRVSAAEAARWLGLMGGAPLTALDCPQHPAYQLRAQWLSDWLELVQGHVSALTLSLRWQKTLDVLSWFDILEWMLRDVQAYHAQLPVIQTDLTFEALARWLPVASVFGLQQKILHFKQAQQQNVQPALIYDSLMMQLAQPSTIF